MQRGHFLVDRRRRSFSGLKVPALKVLTMIAVFLLAAPLAWLAGDLWRLSWVVGEGRQDEARNLLLRGVMDSAEQAGEWRHLHAEWGQETPRRALPVIATSFPRLRADEVIPYCPPAPNEVGHRPLNWPRLAADNAQFSLTRARLGTATIIALDVCLNATPFAGVCERRLRKAREFTIDEIGGEAVRLGTARVERGLTCWCSAYSCASAVP